VTQTYPYTVVDVFTTEPLSGNSLAVFGLREPSLRRPIGAYR
jgi:predicted PhzF superfamily epimerase YddE/YHI9